MALFSRVTTRCLLLMLAIPLSPAQSTGVLVEQTRIVFSAEDKAQTVAVRNTGDQTYLVQAHVLNSPTEMMPGPFLATPPMFKLKKDSRQLLRILPQDNTLSADRESLFWLVISAIPSQSAPVDAGNRLSIGLRFALKLFYRPEGLTSPPEDTACRLSFHQETKGLRINNPTPWFQTLGALSLDKAEVDITQHPIMVPPLENLHLSSAAPVQQARWQTINDYGGLSTACQQALAATQEVAP